MKTTNVRLRVSRNARFSKRLVQRCMAGLVAAIALFGCDLYPDDLGADAGRGSAAVGVTAQSLSADDIAGVTISVSGAGIDPALTQALSVVEGQWQGVIESIPAGADRTFTAEAVDADGLVIYEGTAENITIEDGQTVAVQIFLQPAAEATAFENSVPRFTAVAASDTTVAPGELVFLTAAATDPDPDDTLVYAWSADGGSFETADAPSTTWTAPDVPGTYQLTVSATDPKGAGATLDLSMTVTGASGGGAAAVTLSINTWPEIQGLIASPTRIDINDLSLLDLTAVDPDGDTLTFTWQADCAGTFDDGSAADPSFVLQALPEDGADCILHVEIEDGRGGVNHAAISLETGPGVNVDGSSSGDAIFSTGFEAGDPLFENLASTGNVSTEPPAGTLPRTGSGVVSLSSITTNFRGRQLESVACIPLLNDQDQVQVTVYGTASTDNGGNQIAVRVGLIWYTDADCAVPNDVEETLGEPVNLPEGVYAPVTLSSAPPLGATHAKLRLELRDDNGGDNTGDDWAIDDITISM